MTTKTRFEVRLPAGRRAELDALAHDVGLSSADLVRLGIRWMLDHKEALFRPEARAVAGLRRMVSARAHNGTGDNP